MTSRQPTVGLDIEDGAHLKTAETRDEWADSVTHLLNCPEIRAELGLAGRLYVDQTHHWHHCLSILDELLGLESSEAHSRNQSHVSLGT